MESDAGTHLAFSIHRSSLRERILIPKYYDPELQESVAKAKGDEWIVAPLRELLLTGRDGSHLGNWVARSEYGGGDVPYIRTTDFGHWRLRPDFKKGVSSTVFERFQNTQDVKPGDLLLVAHGSYLIGNVAMVTETDIPLVLQDHVLRLRVNPEGEAEGDPFLLLAALSTSFVRRQMRAKQFSADIIDKIGNRHLDVMVALPRDRGFRSEISKRVRLLIERQSDARRRIQEAASSPLRMTRERAATRHSFRVQRRSLRDRNLIPKYYDPGLEIEIAEAEAESPAPWIEIGDLVTAGQLSAETGVEVGKMAYGTGSIPFIRTSDLVDWEIRRDPKQGIGEDILKRYSPKGVLEPLDVLVVRDGTYLVGSSAIVMEEDVPAMFCAGIYRLRVVAPREVDPFAFLAVLNLPLVRQQMRAKQFTRDVIDTLGRRLLEVKIPAHVLSPDSELARGVREVMNLKSELKAEIGRVIDAMEPTPPRISAGRPGWSMR